MEEVIGFFNDEMRQVIKLKSSLEKEIRTIKYDIEFVERVIRDLEIKAGRDINILFPAKSYKNFEEKELENLSKRRGELQTNLDKYTKELSDADFRYEKLRYLHDLCNHKNHVENKVLENAEEKADGHYKKQLENKVLEDAEERAEGHYKNQESDDTLKVKLTDNKCSHDYRYLTFQEINKNELVNEIYNKVIINLISAILKNEYAAKVLERDAGQAKEELSDINNVIRLSIDELKTVIKSLRPVSSESLSLEDAVNEVIYDLRVKALGEIVCNCDIKNIEKYDIGYEVIISVVRIIKSLCENVVSKYSSLKTVIYMNIVETQMSAYMLEISIVYKFSRFDFSDEIDYNIRDFGLPEIIETVYVLGGTVASSNKCIEAESGKINSISDDATNDAVNGADKDVNEISYIIKIPV